MKNQEIFYYFIDNTIYKDIISTIISVASLKDYNIKAMYYDLITNTEAIVLKLENNKVIYEITFEFENTTSENTTSENKIIIKTTIEINESKVIENKCGFMIAESLQRILEEL